MQGKHLLAGLWLVCPLTYADHIDDVIRQEMARRHIPGLSIAIVDGGNIVKAKGYGVSDQGSKETVSEATLFQAGSVSKPVAAMAALKLVEQGKLNLDDDVNHRLTSWKLPETEFTRDKKVSLRAILSHSAGLNLHGFPGYALQAPIPDLIQILNGSKPANTPAIRSEATPGSGWNYSGGGYTVMQQMVLDVTGKPYPDVLQESVLHPLGMNDSTFEQPLPAHLASRAATGYQTDRTPVAGRWHVYPEMAAAGLWSTPSDLARFATGIQAALAGKANPVLSPDLTREMLRVQKRDDGLGLFLRGEGKTLEFSHGGRNEGFDSLFVGMAETGQAVVIMINTNDDSRMLNRIATAVAKDYHWPSSTPSGPVSATHWHPSPKALQAFCGLWDDGYGRVVTMACHAGQLQTMSNGLPDDQLIPAGKDQFVSLDQTLNLHFARDQRGQISDVQRIFLGNSQALTKIGPPTASHTPHRDTNPQRTETVARAVSAMAKGDGAIMEVNGVTNEARKAWAHGEFPEFKPLGKPVFLAEYPVHQIKRIGSTISKVVYYRAMAGTVPRTLLVYLDAQGWIADIDLIDEIAAR